MKQQRSGIARQERRLPLVSVIIPVCNEEEFIGDALEALFRSIYPFFEVIVVSDGSTDRTEEIARKYPCRLIQLEPGGIARAENAGAATARGEILYFTDGDVITFPDTLQLMVSALYEHQEVAGVSGAYSLETPSRNFISLYKNALHRYVHCSNSKYTTNLFGANSAIWKAVFDKMGGFLPHQRVLEDVELGYRMTAAGHRILMAPDIAVVHQKRYTLRSLIQSDVFGRAVPWIGIMLQQRRFALDLNTRVRNVLSLGAVWAAPIGLIFFRNAWGRFLLFTALVTFLICNAGLLAYMARGLGVWFAVRALALNFVSYFYQGVGVFLGTWRYLHLRPSVSSSHCEAGNPAQDGHAISDQWS